MKRVAPRALLLLLSMLALPVPVASSAGAPNLATLLLKPTDLPAGYVPDNARENADATARTSAYARVIVTTTFAGFRNSRAAMVQYMARLRMRADTSLVLAAETNAVARTHGTTRVTLPTRLGDRSTTTYQAQGTRGQL